MKKTILKRLVSCFISGAMMLSMASIILPTSISAEPQNCPYPYTLFASDAETKSINAISASNFTINGSICTNGTFITSANNPNINGQRIEKADEEMIYIIDKIKSTYFGGSNVETYNVDYRYANMNINQNNPLSVAGELELTGNINLNSSIMALGDIVLNGEVKNSNNTVIFSKYGDIIINNYSNVNLNSGLIYAPFGNVVINSSNVNINGIIIAKSITFNTPNVNVNYNSNIGNFVGYISELPNIPFDEWGYLPDTDGDELPDIIENNFFDTDSLNPDTDGDGLPDGYEVLVLGTDPLNVDTDNNGISDADEDFDDDGLNNLGEYTNGTNPWGADSDGDGLTDGDEVHVYGTGPLNPDTDGDGLPDALELKYNMIPTNPDTLDDGILDGDRVFEVSLDSELSDNGLVQAHLLIELQGKQIESLTIDKVSEDDLFLNPEIPGYLGNAFDFNVDGEFSKATLTYEFDESFFDDLEFVPAIYYWDEEAQFLDELPNQTIVGNTVSVELEHFSVYVIVSKNEHDKAFTATILPPTDKEYRNRTFDVVLALDESGSISATDYSTMKSLCANLVSKLDDDDKISVYTFGSTVRRRSGFSDKSSAISTISGLNKNGGNTAIYNAINAANNEFISYSNSNATRIMIVLTDGQDNSSTYSSTSVTNTAFNNNIVIYTIGIGSVNATVLNTIANSTGGAYYSGANFSQLEGIFNKLISDADLYRDSDNDGISDYHEKKISTGELRLGTGAPMLNFASLNYLNPDSDGDGLIDGEELTITFQTVKGLPVYYCFMKSNPCLNDTDFDGITDDGDNNPISNKFSGSMKDGYASYDVEFSVDYRKFFKDNTDYQKDLAVLGSIYASLAYSDNTRLTVGGLNNANIDSAFAKFGLKNITNYNLAKYYNDDDISEMTVGHKVVEYKGAKKEIIVVSVRGTDSTIEEWSSNFDVGADTSNYWNRNNTDWKNKNNHKGFDVAANRLYDRIISYVSSNVDYNADKVIYIVGHSRGAAIANILGSKFENLSNYDSFVYTYATPNTTTSINYGGYKTIFNIVNTDDLVPYLPLDSWGFNKYGTTYKISITDKYENKWFGAQKGTWEWMFGVDYNYNGHLKSTLKAFESVVSNREDIYSYTDDSNTIYTYSDSYYNDSQTSIYGISNRYGERISRHCQIYAVSKGFYPINGTLEPEVEVFDVKVKQTPAFFMMVIADVAASKQHSIVNGNDTIINYSTRGTGEETYFGSNVGFYVAKKYQDAKSGFIKSGADSSSAGAFLHFGGTIHAHMPGSYYFLACDYKNLLPH